MRWEEFEAVGLDAERDSSLNDAKRTAAREHANTCSRCAALQDSWQAARVELRAFREATVEAQAPARVEMRLRLEFRTQHRTLKLRRTAVIAAWALATGALLVGAVSWKNWKKNQQVEATRHGSTAPGVPSRNLIRPDESGSRVENATLNNLYAVIPSEDGAGDFTLLPGSLAAQNEQAAILRVRMQRGALGALGLPVNEERAGEWIQVDLLVGVNGLAQAVRLAR